MVTTVPPVVGPEVGSMPVTVGGRTYLWLSPLVVPPGAVAVTWTAPVPAGAVAVIWVAELTVNEVAAVAPNETAVAPARSVPVRMTAFPPPGGPTAGDRSVSVGAAT